MDDERYSINSRVAFRKIDEKVIVVNPVTDVMYSLNATGSFIWESLNDNSLDNIAEQLSERFEVNFDDACSDIRSFIAKMLEEGLVEKCKAVK